MDRTLSNFIRALRNAEVRVSTAETLDAFNTVELVGYRDRDFLKNALSMVLPKTADEKETFEDCFEQFFSFKTFANDASAANEGAEPGDEQGGGEHAETGEAAESAEGEEGRQGSGGGEGGRKKKSKNAYGLDAEEEEDLGEGAMAEAQSKLGQLLMNEDRTELSMAMSTAGQEVNVQEIAVFTQKGVVHPPDHGGDGPGRNAARSDRPARTARKRPTGAWRRN